MTSPTTPGWLVRLWRGFRRCVAIGLFTIAFICEGLGEWIYENPFDN
jgi:hypothetical protein